MPVNKFVKSEDVVTNIPSISASIGVTMSQKNNAFLQRDGSNTVVGDINIDKHKLFHLGGPSADDDAATRKYVDKLIHDTGEAVLGTINVVKNMFPKIDSHSIMTGSLTMGVQNY